ncbi:MAG: molybdopterin-dependent oxidoreductase [Candidatus Methanoperedens sp.]|nr:molybdopterin-dependent oxidoreductase [Candidatus Methanoperedens sp.]MCZ7370310.1 molybdopterin-dependent oxidoreductase [Candidatus Methanoperedens sp.]
MSQEKEPESAPESNYAMTRRKLLIFLGIFLGIIIAGFSIIKEAGIKTINKFRIRSIEQTPSFDPDKWELIVEGLVNTPLAISYNELLGLENEEQMTDFHCVEGWSVDKVKWKGVRLKVLFDRAGLRPEAAFATFHSASGLYSDSLSIKEALEPYVMLAYMMNDEALSDEQGKPMRLVMPRMFGYKNVKWVNKITLTATQETGYWENYGYKIDGVSYP